VKKVKILMLDDCKNVLAFYKLSLGLYDFDVITTESNEEAIRLLEADSEIKCILIDYQMPEISGPDFCITLKSNPKLQNLPAIILTANDDKQSLLSAIKSGADDFMSKKLDPEIISYKITAAIRFGDLYKQQIDVERIKTTHAMITTLNHQINNPLAIAYGMLGSDFGKLSQDRYHKVIEALDRITQVVRKIEEMSDDNIEFEEYVGDTSMLKL
jgi:CheY-like chemotaxis protein